MSAIAASPTALSFDPGDLEIGDCWDFSALSRAGWEQLCSICGTPPIGHHEIEVDGHAGVELHGAPTVRGAMLEPGVFRDDFDPPAPLFHLEERPSLPYVRADVAARLVESTDGILARYVDTEAARRERKARLSTRRPETTDAEQRSAWLPLGLVKPLRIALERAWEAVRDDPDHEGIHGFGVHHAGSEYRLFTASERGLDDVVAGAMKGQAGDIRQVLRRELRHAIPATP